MHEEENDIMDNFEMNINISPTDKNYNYYQSFAKQVSDWYSDGKVSELASQDTRFMLELQKEKLKSLGLELKMKTEEPEVDTGRVSSISYGDNVFVNSIIGGNKHITISVYKSQNEIFRYTGEGTLSIIMQNPKEGNLPSPKTPVCCPHCGAPSTLGKLEDGCEFCDSKFLMDELYPKVMHFFIKEDNENYFEENQIKKYILGGFVFFSVLSIGGMIIDLLTGGTRINIVFEVVSRLAGSLLAGAIFGGIAWFIAGSVGSVKLMRKSARGATKTMNSLSFCHKMRLIDPTFSTEYFRDKSMSLLKLMIYSKNPQELTICKCDKPIPEKFREIVDMTYFNSGVDKYSFKDGICNVSLTFYTDSLHYHNGEILRKSDKIRMSLRKVIKKPTNLGFSAMAVSCPSCGASFDAEKLKNCPFCDSAYPLEENEWVVTDISI